MKRSIGDDVATYRDGVPVAVNIPGLLWMKVLNFAFAKRISALCHVVRGQHHI